MSLELMSRAWQIALPPEQKLALLAVCDNAQDSGECRAPLDILVKRCLSMSEKAVIRCLDQLEKKGYLRCDGRVTL